MKYLALVRDFVSWEEAFALAQDKNHSAMYDQTTHLTFT